jgi:hypothetical protein
MPRRGYRTRVLLTEPRTANAHDHPTAAEQHVRIVRQRQHRIPSADKASQPLSVKFLQEPLQLLCRGSGQRTERRQ